VLFRSVMGKTFQQILEEEKEINVGVRTFNL
jgi:hypothetical protein